MQTLCPLIRRFLYAVTNAFAWARDTPNRFSSFTGAFEMAVIVVATSVPLILSVTFLSFGLNMSG